MSFRFRSLITRASTTLSRKGVIALFDQAAASLTNFLTGVIIGRSCAQEEFGLYMLCYSTIILIADIQMSLISSPYMVFSQRLSGRKLTLYTGSIFCHQMVLSLILIFLLIAGALLFSWIPSLANLPDASSYTAVLWSLAATITFILLRDYIRKVCFALFHMNSALLIDVSSGILQLAGLLVLARMKLMSAASSFGVIGVACALTTGLWLYGDRHSFSVDLRQAIDDFKKNWAFSKWIFFSGILWALGMTAYPWLLTLFHGTAANAIWGACFAIAALGNPLKLGVQNYLGPKVVQEYTRGGLTALWKYVFKSSGIFCVAISPLSLLLFFFGETLLVVIYGEQFAGNGRVISVLALDLLAGAAIYAVSRALLAIERSDLFFIGNIVPLTVMLTAGLMLVKEYGPFGVAAALLTGTLVTSIVMFSLFAGVLRRGRLQETSPEESER